jgi:hypothetical protein
MNFEVYCDESSVEALTNSTAHTYAAIGGLWLPAEYRVELKETVNAIKAKNNITGEVKWKKVSPAYLHVYKELIDYFFRADYLRFRVILIEASKVNHYKFNNSDAELGFYKFYYQLLHHWIYDFNIYSVFIDLKINRNKGRLKELEKLLAFSNLTSDILQVQGLPSEQSTGIQLADVLTGLVTAKFNKEITGTAKIELIRSVEEHYLKKPIAPTPKWEEKLNVFKINLEGGW